VKHGNELENALNEVFVKTSPRRQDVKALMEFAVAMERWRCAKISQHYEEMSAVALEIRHHIEGASKVIS
jgi:hypothetical protein